MITFRIRHHMEIHRFYLSRFIFTKYFVSDSIKLSYPLSLLIFHLYQCTDDSDLISFSVCRKIHWSFGGSNFGDSNRMRRRDETGMKHHTRKGGRRSRVKLMREESRSRLLFRRVKMPGMLNECFKKDGSVYAE